jgi:hypothetical protein
VKQGSNTLHLGVVSKRKAVTVQQVVQAHRGLEPSLAEVGHLGGVGSRGCNRRPQEEEGAPNEGYSEGLCKAMNTTTVKVLTCLALFVVVIALALVALMLMVPAATEGLTYSGYY